MHHYQDKQHSPYSTTQLFALVMDIERYPEFLPWCRASRILERSPDRIVAELVVNFKAITESYTSEVFFHVPDAENGPGAIEVKLIKGPFRHLDNHWKFTSSENGGSEISLDLSFQFRSMLLDAVIGVLFGKACARMVTAFKQRADALYSMSS